MRRASGAFLCVALLIAATPGAGAGVSAGVDARAWVVIDTETGAVLDAGSHHDPLAVGTAVQLMTALTALQRLPTDRVVVSTDAALDAPSPGLGMEENEQWELGDVLQALLLSSANDAAYALAESAAGSLDAFTTDMATLAQRIGLEDSTFADPAGLDDATTMSAYDLAVVARSALAAPPLSATVKLADYRVVGPGGIETGLVESDNDFVREYDGATGVKSAESPATGTVLVASASREGRALVAVVLGSSESIAAASALLDGGFATAPGTKGAGERLPEMRAGTAQDRLLAYGDLPRVLGRPAPIAPQDGPGASIATAPPPPRPPAPAPEAGGGGLPVLEGVAVAGAAGLVVVLVLRRRAVDKQQRRVVLGRRSFVEARRRGTIDVVDPAVNTEPTNVRVVRE